MSSRRRNSDRFRLSVTAGALGAHSNNCRSNNRGGAAVGTGATVPGSGRWTSVAVVIGREKGTQIHPGANSWRPGLEVKVVRTCARPHPVANIDEQRICDLAVHFI